jgi:hypothetical protein
VFVTLLPPPSALFAFDCYVVAVISDLIADLGS